MPSKSLLLLLQERRRRQIQTQSNHCSLILPGAFNGLSARLVADAGFQAAYISGAAVSACKGCPDIGLVTLNEFCDVIKDVSRNSGVPVLVDADTGFGQSEMIHRTVHDYFHSGASGFHIEDQMFPKRCGHLNGKELVSRLVMAENVRCARETSDHYCNGEFIVCARTDARGVTSLEDAISRACDYVAAGAHMIFPEGLTSIDEFKVFASSLHQRFPDSPYLLANMTEFGKSPSITAAALGEMGYDAVIYPVSSLRCAMFAVKTFLDDLQQHGYVSEDMLLKMQTRQELYQALHYIPGQHWTFPTPSTCIKRD